MGLLEFIFGKRKTSDEVEENSTIVAKPSKADNAVAIDAKGFDEKSTIQEQKYNDIRLYYNDIDGNECEKLIRNGEIWTTITGIRFRKNPEKIMDSIYEGAIVVLKPEPDNPVDPYAVAVYFNGEHIGYVPKRDVPAILTCINPNGTKGTIDKIDDKFIGIVLPGTMEYIHSHISLSKFNIIVRSSGESQKLSAIDEFENFNFTPTIDETQAYTERDDDWHDNSDETEYDDDWHDNSDETEYDDDWQDDSDETECDDDWHDDSNETEYDDDWQDDSNETEYDDDWHDDFNETEYDDDWQDDSNETEYVKMELVEELALTQTNLMIVRDNIGRKLNGESPVFIGLLDDGIPKYINPDTYEVIELKNELMEECLRKGYNVWFMIEGLSDREDLASKISIRVNAFFETVFLKNRLEDLKNEIDFHERTIDILSELKENSKDGISTYAGEHEIEGDEEFNDKEMANWGDYCIRIPFTLENEEQFLNICPYLVTGKFMCFKGKKEFGAGVYYCKKYEAYLKFNDTQLDAHIEGGGKVAFYIRDLNLSDKINGIVLKVALHIFD